MRGGRSSSLLGGSGHDPPGRSGGRRRSRGARPGFTLPAETRTESKDSAHPQVEVPAEHLERAGHPSQLRVPGEGSPSRISIRGNAPKGCAPPRASSFRKEPSTSGPWSRATQPAAIRTAAFASTGRLPVKLRPLRAPLIHCGGPAERDRIPRCRVPVRESKLGRPVAAKGDPESLMKRELSGPINGHLTVSYR